MSDGFDPRHAGQWYTYSSPKRPRLELNREGVARMLVALWCPHFQQALKAGLRKTVQLADDLKCRLPTKDLPDHVIPFAKLDAAHVYRELETFKGEVEGIESEQLAFMVNATQELLKYEEKLDE